MHSYTIMKSANETVFIQICKRIEAGIKDIKKDALLLDVDGSAIQVYTVGNFCIKVCNDYELDAVYVDSDIELHSCFDNVRIYLSQQRGKIMLKQWMNKEVLISATNGKSWSGTVKDIVQISRMKVRYIKETIPLCLTHNKVYEVVSIEKGWYRIVDDSHEDYLYPPEVFEIIER